MEVKPGAAKPNWMLLPFTQHFPGHALEPVYTSGPLCALPEASMSSICEQ